MRYYFRDIVLYVAMKSIRIDREWKKHVIENLINLYLCYIENVLRMVTIRKSNNYRDF
jgi:hypothetical protein